MKNVMILRLIATLIALFLTTFELASCYEANPMEIRQFQQVIYLELTSDTSANASIGDLDRDGYLDIIAANRNSPSYVCLNDTKGNFIESGFVKIPFESATTIVPADFNGDGFVDLAIPHRDGGQSVLFFNDGKARERLRFREPICHSDAGLETSRNGIYKRYFRFLEHGTESLVTVNGVTWIAIS